MIAPWNVRVRAVYPPFYAVGDRHVDYYTVETRVKGQWLDSGTARTWWHAFFQGLAS